METNFQRYFIYLHVFADIFVAYVTKEKRDQYFYPNCREMAGGSHCVTCTVQGVVADVCMVEITALSDDGVSGCELT